MTKKNKIAYRNYHGFLQQIADCGKTFPGEHDVRWSFILRGFSACGTYARFMVDGGYDKLVPIDKQKQFVINGKTFNRLDWVLHPEQTLTPRTGTIKNYTQYFNKNQYRQLLANGSDCSDYSELKDYPPVVKLVKTKTDECWLISEIDPKNTDIVFGIYIERMAVPVIGYFSISELEEIQEKYRYLKTDETFRGRFPLSVYLQAAQNAGRIVTDEVALLKAAGQLQP